MIPRIYTLEEIDRSVFHTIRSVVVSHGYLPDAVNYQNNAAGWDTAKTAIKQAGKEIIEVFGVGLYESKGDVLVNKIMIEQDSKRRGSTSLNMGGNHILFNEVENQYEEYRLPKTTKDLYYSFRVVYSGAKYLRIIDEFFMEAFDTEAMKIWDSVEKEFTEETIEVLLDNDQDLSIPELSIRGYYLKIQDVLLGTLINTTPISTTIPTIEEATLIEQVGTTTHTITSVTT
jgi:hypothetical protein